jgi:hypothetical protein
MTVLGVVAEVNDSDVLMHLPNGVKVHINAARVSDFVTRQYRAALVSVSAREDQDAASGTDESDEEAAETERVRCACVFLAARAKSPCRNCLF